jgi:hypothetical protein
MVAPNCPLARWAAMSKRQRVEWIQVEAELEPLVMNHEPETENHAE